jgi:DNA-binding XRE family transcriptional regulator
MLSFRFKSLYQNIGLDRAGAAKLLRVSERTVLNWENGVHEIPYSAYKVMRLLTYSQLPGSAWKGWHFCQGKLWTPEGHGFVATDSNWWSLLCRRAASSGVLYDQNRVLKAQLAAKAQRPGGAGDARDAVLLMPKEGDVQVTRHQMPDCWRASVNLQFRQALTPVCHNVKFRYLKIKSANLIQGGAK